MMKQVQGRCSFPARRGPWFRVIALLLFFCPGDALVGVDKIRSLASSSPCWQPPDSSSRIRPKQLTTNNHRQRRPAASQLYSMFPFMMDSTTTSQVLSETVSAGHLSDFAPAATSLFNNMKLPAAVVTAGMISLGFATSFPELPADKKYSKELRKRCESLRRLHIVVALISVTSELIVVMWAAVEVNQLTERFDLPMTSSVWDLISQECDLAWSAVNSHFVLGIIGFVSMLAIRAYVMLIAAEASPALMSAAMTGTGAALCLMISIVNRGVETGGGGGVGYGKTIVDLLQHYIWLLFLRATDAESPGPLEMMAILLEITSIGFAAKVFFTGQDKTSQEGQEGPLLEEDKGYATYDKVGIPEKNDMVWLSKEEPKSPREKRIEKFMLDPSPTMITDKTAGKLSTTADSNKEADVGSLHMEVIPSSRTVQSNNLMNGVLTSSSSLAPTLSTNKSEQIRDEDLNGDPSVNSSSMLSDGSDAMLQ